MVRREQCASATSTAAGPSPACFCSSVTPSQQTPAVGCELRCKHSCCRTVQSRMQRMCAAAALLLKPLLCDATAPLMCSPIGGKVAGDGVNHDVQLARRHGAGGAAAGVLGHPGRHLRLQLLDHLRKSTNIQIQFVAGSDKAVVCMDTQWHLNVRSEEHRSDFHAGIAMQLRAAQAKQLSNKCPITWKRAGSAGSANVAYARICNQEGRAAGMVCNQNVRTCLAESQGDGCRFSGKGSSCTAQQRQQPKQREGQQPHRGSAEAVAAAARKQRQLTAAASPAAVAATCNLKQPLALSVSWLVAFT